jgi:hypothetical protein
MENTYTYIARDADDPAQIATFTLFDHSLSVGLGAPLEQIERALETQGEDQKGEERIESRLWLKPLAVSLLERGVGPFRIADVNATAKDDWLRVSAWYRAGGLALVPITLIYGRVDNPLAAQAFVEELDRRKSEVMGAFGLFNISDDGIVLSACRYINASSEGIDLPLGLGSRHMAAASITKHTNAIAVVVSESSVVRVFDNGEIVSEIIDEVYCSCPQVR